MIADDEYYLDAEDGLDGDGDGDDGAGRGAGGGPARAVAFGLRAAALAGVVVSVGAVAAGLAGVFDPMLGVEQTTCCGGS